MHLFCDFDGTISTVDTTDHILEALADPRWRDIEADWLAGRIDAAACMRAQIALIGGSDADLDAQLDRIALDPGFLEFVDWAEQRRLPLTIVSDGVDHFIRRILGRHGLERLPVVSNRLAGAAGARQLEHPFRRAGCAGGSGVCKCEVIRAWESAGRAVVFVGDGRSDFCASGRADVLFAKGKLAEFAASRNRPFHTYQTFHDVTAQLDGLMAERLAAI